MKRQRPTAAGVSSSSSSSKKRGAGPPPAVVFTGATVLLVEDGREEGITSMRAEMLMKRIKALGGAVNRIKAQGNRLTIEERDKRLLHVTHVVTGLLSLGRRGVLEGLRGLPGEGEGNEEEPAFKVVKPEWVTACIQQQRLVATADYELPFEPSITPAAASPSTNAAAAASSSSPPGNGAKQKQPQLTPPPRTRAQIEAILDRNFPPEIDAATREAYIAWGGPLDITTGKDMPRWACQRPAPRIHPNLALAGALEETKEFYHATGDHQRVKAWARALSVVRAWPREIRDAGELKGAHFIGNGIIEQVAELLDTGTTQRLEAFRKSERSVALKDLTRVHQVGSATAAAWYEQGYRSVDQILAEVDAAPDGDPTQTRFYQTIKPSPEPWMGVLHFRDYSQKMSRATVASLEAKVREAATIVLQRKGVDRGMLLLETCGGYRRGKEENGDADVLVSYWGMEEGGNDLPQAIKGVLRGEMGMEVVELKEGGAVQGYTTNGPPHEQLESHNNTLVLIKHEGLFRRLDIISPPPDQWAACVLGWSGTMQMEKDLRSYAEEEKNGYLTQQALYDRESGDRVKNPHAADGIFRREEEIWEVLGLKWIPPVLRWA